MLLFRRWIKRIAIGVFALGAIATVFALVFVHTDTGREVVRKQVEAQLDKLFVDDVAIGKLEGSPFGKLVVHDVVVMGRDGKPVVTIGTLSMRLQLLPLVDNRVVIDELVIEDGDIDVRRDANGALILPALVPNDKKTAWDVRLPAVRLARTHVAIEGNNLDDVSIGGNAHIETKGTTSGEIEITAMWRERHLPISVDASFSDDTKVITSDATRIRVGGVFASATGVRVERRPDRAPLVAGIVSLFAPRAGVAAIEPSIDLPDDVTLSVDASRPGPIQVVATVGHTELRSMVIADLDAMTATGAFATDDVDLAKLTKGKIHASGALSGTFMVSRDAAAGYIVGNGVYEQLPRGDFLIAAAIDRKNGEYVLDRGEVVVTAKSPVRGSLDLVVKASGALTPKPNLAVRGTVNGKRLVLDDKSVGTIAVTFDATGVPETPAGSATVKLTDLRAGAERVEALELAASAKSIEGDNVSIDITRHRLRYRGTEWSGTSGHLVVGAQHAELRDFHSRSNRGALALAGSFDHGDVIATVDVEHGSLALLDKGYAGWLDAHLRVARIDGIWSGDLAMTGDGVALAPGSPIVKLDAKITARPGSVVATVNASSPDVGHGTIAFDIAAPTRLDDIAAWKRKGRESIRFARIDVRDFDLARLDTTLAGNVSGSLGLTAKAVTGALQLRGLRSPKLQGIRRIDADLTLAQTRPDEVIPTLAITVADIGRATATMRVAIPERTFDPAAWKALGMRALRGGTIETDAVRFDPAFWDRLKIASALRGRAKLVVTIGSELKSVGIHAIVDDLRGTPLAKPVSVDVLVDLDGAQATATIAMTSQGAPITLAKITGHMPLTLAQLQRVPLDVDALKQLPIVAKLELPKTSAEQLVNVFGRSEITGGTIDGTVVIGGTIARPTVVAKIEGLGIEVPPGPNGKPVKVIERIVIDGNYDGVRGKIAIDGFEGPNGQLHAVVEGSTLKLADASARVTATEFDLAPLLMFAPGPAGASRGTLDANLVLHGLDVRTAKITGELHVREARIPLAPTIGTLRRANIDIVVKDKVIELGVVGKLGRGDVKVAGTIGLDGVNLSAADMKITLRKVSPIGEIEPIVDADVTAKIHRENLKWIADIVVDHGLIKVSTARGEAIKPSSNPPDLTIGRAAIVTPVKQGTPPARPVLVANITLRPARVESTELKTTLQGKLAITADAESLGIVGEITALSGDVDLFDRRYRLERAAVRFDGSPDPLLDIKITHDFSDVTTITNVRGRASKPELELSSNPGIYSQSQLLGFVLGGEPDGDPNNAGARDKLTGAGASFIAGRIGGYVKKALPFDIDVIKYEAAGVESSAAITVGSWITHTLFFAFRQHLDARPDENSGEGTLEYWITRRVEVEVTAGDRNYDSIDVLWRRRF